jgi:hypothetical protein
MLTRGQTLYESPNDVHVVAPERQQYRASSFLVKDKQRIRAPDVGRTLGDQGGSGAICTAGIASAGTRSLNCSRDLLLISPYIRDSTRARVNNVQS